MPGRRRSLGVGLALIGGFSAAQAICTASHQVTSIPFPGGPYSYVHSPQCPGAAGCSFGVGAGLKGFFWALGHGDPAIGQGHDNGTFQAWPQGWVTSSYYGDPGASSFILTNWGINQGPNAPDNSGIDGCIDQVAVPGTGCMAILLNDRYPSSTWPFLNTTTTSAVLTAPRTLPPYDRFEFGQPGNAPINLAPLPSPSVLAPGPFGDSFFQPGGVFPSPVLSGAGRYLEPVCADPVAGYRIYIARMPHGAPPPAAIAGPPWQVARGGQMPDGSPIPLGQSTHVIYECSSTTVVQSVALVYALVFDSGFETPYYVQYTQFSDGDGSGPVFGCCQDVDHDGYCPNAESPLSRDCNDASPTVFPDAPQVCDGVNNDCRAGWPSLAGTNEYDDDGDGLSECAGDCDDADPGASPGIAEVCDGRDNNCDGRSDEAPAFALKRSDPATHPGDGFGKRLAAVADVDGDGVRDLLVAAPEAVVGGAAAAGRVTLFSGATLAPLHVFTHPAPAAGDHFGEGLAGLGDLDGDGVGEILIGATLDSTAHATEAGSVRIYSGAAGFATLHTLEDSAGETGDLFGVSAADVGDVNDDDVRDFALGVRGDDLGRGSVRIHSGSDGALLRTLALGPAAPGDALGYSVAGGADLDADGVPDIVGGAIAGDSTIAADAGTVTVFSGSDGSVVRTLFDPLGAPGDQLGRGLSLIGDLDADDVTDVVAGAPGFDASAGVALVFSGATGDLIRRIEDPNGNAGDRFGYRVEALRDIDGDGLDDLLVGAYADTIGSAPGAGSVNVFSSGSGAAIRKLVDPDAMSGDALGFSVAGAGDVDNDGLEDLFAGAWRDDTANGSDAGSVVVFAAAAEEDPDDDGLGNACDPDDDGDAIADTQDCAPLDASAAEFPGDVGPSLTWYAPASLQWAAASAANTYTLYRGSFSARGSWDWNHACLIGNLEATAATDGSIPITGGYYYLVAGVNACGIGSLGQGADGERPAGGACP